MFETVLQAVLVIGFLALLVGYTGDELRKPQKKKKGKHKTDFFGAALKHSWGFSIYAFVHTLGFLNRAALSMGRGAGSWLRARGRRLSYSARPAIRKLGRAVEAVGNGACSYPRILGVLLIFVIVGILSL